MTVERWFLSCIYIKWAKAYHFPLQIHHKLLNNVDTSATGMAPGTHTGHPDDGRITSDAASSDNVGFRAANEKHLTQKCSQRRWTLFCSCCKT